MPTRIEAGLPGYEVSLVFAVVMLAGTSGPIVARLNREINEFMATPEVKRVLAARAIHVTLRHAGSAWRPHRRRNRTLARHRPEGRHQAGLTTAGASRRGWNCAEVPSRFARAAGCTSTLAWDVGASLALNVSSAGGWRMKLLGLLLAALVQASSGANAEVHHHRRRPAAPCVSILPRYQGIPRFRRHGRDRRRLPVRLHLGA